MLCISFHFLNTVKESFIRSELRLFKSCNNFSKIIKGNRIFSHLRICIISETN